VTPTADNSRPPRATGKGERPAKADTKPARRRAARASGARRPSGAEDPREQPGVLSNLPSTRPQRPSARRAAAKRAAAEPSAAKPTTAKPAKPLATKPERRRAKRATLPPAEPPIPRQGFESEDAIEPGTPVQPPSRPELAASVAELLGELAQTGLATGGRLLRDALGRLRGV
jgi:hypothetical protein